MRCVTLADALRERGAVIRFICRAHPGHLEKLLQQRGMVVCLLATPKEESTKRDLDGYAAWLGASQKEDATQTIEALHNERPDWLIVDHYGLDAEWERMLRPHVARLMVIDDLEDRPHDCDLLLNQNYSNETGERYRALVAAECTLALGTRYALLRPEYAQYRRAQRPGGHAVRRVLIFFGGSDPNNVTGMALDALCKPGFEHLQVDVVIGKNNKYRPNLERTILSRPRTNAFGPRLHLADLMAAADLAIGAGGVTTWERMCLGLPSVVVSIAENQEPSCRALSDAGLIRYLGTFEDVGASAIGEVVREYVDNPRSLLELGTRSKLVVDGLGTSRVAEYIVQTPVKGLRLRPANLKDMPLYFDWVNDLEVRQQAISTQEVTWEEHRKWFLARLTGRQSSLFVLCAEHLPVGQIRFDLEGGEARIDYSLDPLFRGRGWAKHLVALGIQHVRCAYPIVFRADVKESNLPSRAVFIRLGFVERMSHAKRSLRTYIFDPLVHKIPELN